MSRQGGHEVSFAVKKRLADGYVLGDYVVPPNLKDVIGYINRGRFIHGATLGARCGRARRSSFQAADTDSSVRCGATAKPHKPEHHASFG
jgi:hypothetical protein